MLYVQGKCCVHVRFPFAKGLCREAVNQVDADVVESGILTVVYCADGLFPVMSAVEQTQLAVVECLHPHA